MNLLREPVIVYDAKANILFMNDAARELINMSTVETSEQNFTALSCIHGDSIKEEVIIAMQNAAEAKAFDISIPRRGKAVSTLHPVPSENGSLSSVVEIISGKSNPLGGDSYEEDFMGSDSGKLLADLFAVMENEREHISASFEDFAQVMSAIKFRIEQVNYWLEQSGMQQAKSELNVILPLMQKTIRDLVDLQEFLYPSQLRELGLSPTLQMFFRKMKDRFRDIRFTTSIDVGELVWSYDLKLTLYRVLQDIVNVLTYHSLASEVEVDLRQENGSVNLTVRKKPSNGISNETAASRPLTSLHSLELIRKRVELTEGTLSLSRSSEHDLIIQAKWALPV